MKVSTLCPAQPEMGSLPTDCNSARRAARKQPGRGAPRERIAKVTCTLEGCQDAGRYLGRIE